MQDLLVFWDIAHVGAMEPLSSSWGSVTAVTVASGERYVLKRQHRAGTVDTEGDVLRSLHHTGVPVAVPVPTKTGAPYVVAHGAVYRLYPMLPGAVVHDPAGQDGSGWGRRFGHAIAVLHAGLQAWEGYTPVPALDLITQVKAWALPAIACGPGHLDVPRVTALAATCVATLELVTAALPHQWIHRDLHPANMLFEGETLTGIVDFEVVCRGPRVFDLCYCATSLLHDGWVHPAYRTTWPGLFSRLLRGYEATLPLSPSERQALFPTLCAIELIFIAWSVGRQEYGAAQCNQEVLFWLEAHRATIGV
jgi:Ser/Thr protein kinase RdoA (MazF antagonist)